MKVLRQLWFFVLVTMLLFTIPTDANGQDLPHFVSRLDWSPDGTIIAIGYGTDKQQPCQDSSIELVEASSIGSSILRQFSTECRINGLDLTFTSHGLTLLAVTNSAISAWNASSGSLIFNVLDFTSFEDIKWNSSGSYFFAIDFSSTVIRDIQGDFIIRASQADLNMLNAAFTSGDCSPDGDFIVSGFSDGTAQVWQIANSISTVTFSQHVSAVETVAWNPITDLIASGDVNGTIKVWNSNTGAEIISISAHSGSINDLVWSRDGRALASAGDDGVVRVWNIQTQPLPLRLS